MREDAGKEQGEASDSGGTKTLIVRKCTLFVCMSGWEGGKDERWE